LTLLDDGAGDGLEKLPLEKLDLELGLELDELPGFP
tara:strand:- start:249 stop:356 length:108 start_codon:yes stop_codon:yes gene_type:complete